jgi:flagellar biosynthesis/type III secretory pathway chaperone
MPNNTNINQLFERIIALYDSKGDPNQMMGSIMQMNPNLNQFTAQFNNMTQGQSKPQAYMQMAKQLGLSDKNLEGLSRMLGIK